MSAEKYSDAAFREGRGRFIAGHGWIDPHKERDAYRAFVSRDPSLRQFCEAELIHARLVAAVHAYAELPRQLSRIERFICWLLRR